MRDEEEEEEEEERRGKGGLKNLVPIPT